MSEAQITEVIGQVFPELKMETLIDMYRNVRVVEYPPEEVLCLEGALENVFYIVVDGEVVVTKQFDGVEKELDRKMRGEYFGEMALLLQEPRSATVKTAKRSTVIEVDQNAFEQFLKSNAQIVVALSQLTIRQIKRHEQKLMEQLAAHNKVVPAPTKIFLSYSSKDFELAQTLSGDLRTQGIDVWRDQDNIPAGTSWAREVGNALDVCVLMLLLLTEDSLKSSNVEDEWNYFLDEKKTVIPVLVKDVRLPFRLNKLQRVTLLDLNLKNSDQYQIALARIVKAVRFHS